MFKITDKIAEFKFKDEKQFSNLLFTIFKNELINYYKKSKRIEERMKLLQFDDSLSDGKGDDLLQGVSKEVNEKMFTQALSSFWDDPEAENPLLELLHEIIDDLQDWERIILLQRSNGFSYKEIAQYIDKPENQLKVYYMRIKSKVYQQMKMILEEQK